MEDLKNFLFNLSGKAMYLRWRYSGYDHIDTLISLMTPEWRKMRILDIGSGPGKIAGDERFRGVDLTCIDQDKDKVEECKSRGLKAMMLDVRDIPDKFSGGRADIIWCLDILEHLGKPESLNLLDGLERIARRQVIVFIPLGYLPQDREPGKSSSRFVRHRSFWDEEELSRRGYRTEILKGYHWDIRIYCSSLESIPYPVVRDAMWAVKGGA